MSERESVCVRVCESVSLTGVSSPSLSLSPSSAVEIVLMFPLPLFFCRLLAGLCCQTEDARMHECTTAAELKQSLVNRRKGTF